MLETYKPTIQTYNETPSREAEKAATMISRFVYWMTNHSCEQYLIDCYGSVMGQHFWHKIVSRRQRMDCLAADLGFWLELSIDNRNKLMHYILRTKYKNQ